MKTIILISITIGNDGYIPQIKEEIVKFLGTRMISENPSDAPLIQVNQYLDAGDKKTISEIAKEKFESSAVFIIETDDNTFGDEGNMCILKPIDE